MAEPTTTRAALRRYLGRRLKMPFFSLVPASTPYGQTGASSTVGKLVDANFLTQRDRYWNGSWIYFPIDSIDTFDLGGLSRQITAFNAGNDEAFYDHPLGGAPTTGRMYEIYTGFSPEDLHEAINAAIRFAGTNFFQTYVEDLVIIEQEKTSYSLSGLTNDPWMVLNVWLEPLMMTGMIGTAQDGDAAYLTAEANADLSDVDSNWMISIYGGTGAGQLRSVSSVDNTSKEVAPTINWDPAPDSTSLYRLWDPNSIMTGWIRLTTVKADRKEYPDTLYFDQTYASWVGLRIRIQYISTPSELSLDTDATPVPVEYIMLKAKANLLTDLGAQSRYLRSSYGDSAKDLEEQADAYLRRHAFQIPTATIWTDESEVDDGIDASGMPYGNPLGW